MMRILLFWAQLRRLHRENRDLRAQGEAQARELKEERARNVERENFLISQVLTAAGRYGLPKSVDPPRPVEMIQPKPVQPALTALQRAQIAAIEDEGLRLGKDAAEIKMMVDLIKRGEMMPQYEGMDG